MISLHKYLFVGLAMICAASATAQTLHQDIEVDQKLTVTQRDASPLTVLPELALPPLAPATLDYSARVVATKVPNGVTILEPAAFDDPALSTSKRGYAAIGLFPRYNLGVSAGYRAVATRNTRLNIWAQYDGDLYRRDSWIGADGAARSELWRDHAATAALSLRHRLPRKRLLEAGASYLYGYHNQPGHLSTSSQGAGRADARVALSSLLGDMKWRLSADYTYFSFNSVKLPSIYQKPDENLTVLPTSPVTQHHGRLGAAAILPLGETSAFGVDFKGEMLSTSDYLSAYFPFGYNDHRYEFGSTAGLLRLTPYWQLSTPQFSLKAGVLVAATINDGKAFHVAPDVSIAWTPTALFALQARAYGGPTLNPVSGFYTQTPYLNPYSAYGQSNLPLVADLKLTLGSFMGFSLEATAGYAKATDWLMPMQTSDTYGGLILSKTDLKGWRWDVALAYENGRNLDAKVSYGRTPGGVTNAWYADLDRARSHVDASVGFRPFPALRVEAAYHLRTDRSTAITVMVPEIVIDPATNQPVTNHISTLSRASLGNAADLSIGASYQLTDAFTVFAQGRNLLNNSYLLLGGRPAQGVTALVGAQILF